MSLEKQFRQEAERRNHCLTMSNEQKEAELAKLPHFSFTVITSPTPKKESVVKKMLKGLVMVTLSLNLGYMIYIFQHPMEAPAALREYKAYPDFE